MPRLLAALGFFLLLIIPAHALDDEHPRPFDENFDAMTVVDEAVLQGLAEQKRVLLILGANWCHDSRGLAHHFQDEELAATLEQHYVLRFIDIGWRDQNHAVMMRFGVAAIYATPTVFIIDPTDERLLNRDSRNDWGSAASRPIEEAREYFAGFATGDADMNLIESSLVYQSLLIEIEIFEAEQGERLAEAYVDIGRWRALAEEERPDNFMELAGEVDTWRSRMRRQSRRLYREAYGAVEDALRDMAGDAEVTATTVALLDQSDPDISLRFQPFESERW